MENIPEGGRRRGKRVGIRKLGTVLRQKKKDEPAQRKGNTLTHYNRRRMLMRDM